MRSTVLTNIYNEEYLLPFWLEHHRQIFDHGIIIDYNSTDKSIEICKQICPTWEIIKTRNDSFKAIDIDLEFMDIEKRIDGIKMVLNTTEFLFIDRPLIEIFERYTIPTSLSILVDSPYSDKINDPLTINDIYKGLLDPTVKYHNDRHTRTIHTYPHGNYTIGRHTVKNSTRITKDMHCVWLGFYPWNDKLLARKLQIKNNIPQSDKDHKFGFQHLYDTDEMLSIRNKKSSSGNNLQIINPKLFEILCKTTCSEYISIDVTPKVEPYNPLKILNNKLLFRK